MARTDSRFWRQDPPHSWPLPDACVSRNVTAPNVTTQIVLSFDVEEHHRIEAAAAVAIDPALAAHYGARLDPSTRWLLEQLDRFSVKATFFVVGQIALQHARLVRAIADAGHEVASHSWDHRRLHQHTPASFREDLRLSRDALQQAAGQPVLGYRAPTFSVVTHTAWAIDVLAEMGFAYDSSVYPVWHDRYGVPAAPRAPFRVRGERHELLELPPATLRVLGTNLAVGGGGYFRLLPLFLVRSALAQARHCRPAVAVLYFHPWEFDPRQRRLPLGRLGAFRTYVGISRSRARLAKLLASCQTCSCFTRALDVAKQLDRQWDSLPGYRLAGVADGLKSADVRPQGSETSLHAPGRDGVSLGRIGLQQA